jgi:type VI secretion system protein ImpA
MILVEELLQPIAEGNPAGAYLRYDPVYDAIQEARREEDQLNQGAWQRALKTADFPQVISLSTSVLQKRTKDLQIAAWLTEASLRHNGFAGLTAGLTLLHGLLDKFWDSLYPPIEEDDYGEPDLVWRISPLDWIGQNLEWPVRNSPSNRDGHSWHQYSRSRTIGYEDQVREPSRKRSRDMALNEGQLSPELFDKSFTETPEEFYVELKEHLGASLASLAALHTLCVFRFGGDSPSFWRLQRALQDVRHMAQDLLARKRIERL